MERKIKNKALHRSATAMLEKMQNAHYRWEKGDGTLQFQVQNPDTKMEFYKAIDHMKAFIDNIE